MPSRTDTTPLLIQKGQAARLTRVPFDERRFDENWLQQLLFEHPSLIPVDDIEPVFGPLIPVARELQTPSGPLDILYINPEGYPTLVETKLWRNPEARRVVVAQVIDYATQLSKWSYGELVARIKSARGESSESDLLVGLMEPLAEGWDQPRFIDTLSRNLQRGRMLLLIVGDGIQESVEQMAEMLSGAPQLGFTLALVEMALFRPPEASEPLIVQPRIVARTREVVRAIVEVRGEVKPGQIEVHLTPEGPQPPPSGRHRISQDAFLEKLGEVVSPTVLEQLRAFLADTEAIGIVTVPHPSSLSLHYIEPSTGGRFSFGYLRTDGAVDMYYVISRLTTKGLDEQIGRDYLNDVAALVPNAKAIVWKTKTATPAAIKIGSNDVSVSDLLSRRTDWLAAIERMIGRIDKSIGAGSTES